MLWGKPTTIITKRAVAYYRHSAQDRQENSVEIQQDQVRKFAADNGIEIIKEFIDRGITGIVAEGRDGFNDMLAYVENDAAAFDYVLILDVSRWGRFQDTDESAHFSWLCTKKGKRVVYVTMGFPKENDLMHGVQLSFERYRAAAYSRELSGKVWKGCAKIASSGYWAGGVAPYGMCRLLLDEQRNPVQILKAGEHKAIHNQRVTLALGDKAEVDTVRLIFTAFADEAQSPEEIAARLNHTGIPSPGGGRWSQGIVYAMLKNEIYGGVMVWNKTSKKMKSKSRHNPVSDWIRTNEAFDCLVPPEIYARAHQLIKARDEERRRRYSETDMLAKLKALYERYGMVSGRLFASAKMVTPSTYAHHFRSLDLAHQALFREVIDQKRDGTIETIRQSGAEVQLFEDFIVIDNLFSLSIQPVVPIPRGYEVYWPFYPDQRPVVDITVGVPLSCSQQFEVLGYLVFPRLMFSRPVRINSSAEVAVSLYAHPLMPLIQEMRNTKGKVDHG